MRFGVNINSLIAQSRTNIDESNDTSLEHGNVHVMVFLSATFNHNAFLFELGVPDFLSPISIPVL